MIPKSGNRFPAFAKLASAGEARSDKIMLKQKVIDGSDSMTLDRPLKTRNEKARRAAGLSLTQDDAQARTSWRWKLT
jgi:hypothetical protein